ncbi:phage distal tail protein [Streptomonospora salina]|uniref:Siphovirus-type tail component C-terminal domain-containing protein n=1 Tax=Streptomonospora salina TaxID=104205 RepID=A0A841EB24_9ACTN|nr:phage tail domain-containing protein [Streptomonospora salina]MBB6000212.1 hypothetical protein [Streptomonospora salina]
MHFSPHTARALSVLPMAEPTPQPLIISLRVGEDEAALVLSTDPAADESGVAWLLSDIDGWHATPPTEAVVTPLGLSDRSVAAARFPKSPREITVHGYALTGSFDTAEDARNRLYRAFDGYARELPIVVEESTPKRISARTAGAIETAPLGPTHFTFAVPLILPDPLKYGLNLRRKATDAQAPGELGTTFPLEFPLTFTDSGRGTGRMTLTNSGTAPTYPVSVLNGPLSEGWRIVNEATGDFLSFSTGLGHGQRLRIDHAARTADINGAPIAALANGSWWPLQPGRNPVRFLAPAYHPEAAWTASFYDAYL